MTLQKILNKIPLLNILIKSTSFMETDPIILTGKVHDVFGDEKCDDLCFPPRTASFIYNMVYTDTRDANISLCSIVNDVINSKDENCINQLQSMKDIISNQIIKLNEWNDFIDEALS